MTSERFWRGIGGRKMGNGYLAYVTLTAMAFPLHATFGEYAMGMLGALGLTSASVAYEDRKSGSRPYGKRRAEDVRADTDIPESA